MSTLTSMLVVDSCLKDLVPRVLLLWNQHHCREGRMLVKTPSSLGLLLRNLIEFQSEVILFLLNIALQKNNKRYFEM